jgi:hypothetical protein
MRVSAGRRVSADRLTRGAASFVRIFLERFLNSLRPLRILHFLFRACEINAWRPWWLCFGDTQPFCHSVE